MRRSVGGWSAALRAISVLSIATLGLAGCACLEDDWNTYVMYDAEAAEYDAETNCAEDQLKSQSGISAELYESADPALLRDARRVAEPACDRARARNAPGAF